MWRVDKEHVIEYDDEVKVATATLCILDTFRSPPEGFREVIMGHFMSKRRLIRSTLKKWVKHGSDRLKEELPPVRWIDPTLAMLVAD